MHRKKYRNRYPSKCPKFCFFFCSLHCTGCLRIVDKMFFTVLFRYISKRHLFGVGRKRLYVHITLCADDLRLKKGKKHTYKHYIRIMCIRWLWVKRNASHCIHTYVKLVNWKWNACNGNDLKSCFLCRQQERNIYWKQWDDNFYLKYLLYRY